MNAYIALAIIFCSTPLLAQSKGDFIGSEDGVTRIHILTDPVPIEKSGYIAFVGERKNSFIAHLGEAGVKRMKPCLFFVKVVKSPDEEKQANLDVFQIEKSNNKLDPSISLDSATEINVPDKVKFIAYIYYLEDFGAFLKGSKTGLYIWLNGKRATRIESSKVSEWMSFLSESDKNKKTSDNT